MIIQLDKAITAEQRAALQLLLKTEGVSFSELKPSDGDTILARGRPGLNVQPIADLPGVAGVEPDKTNFKLVGRGEHPDDTIVKIGPVAIGGERLAVIAGPCAIESREQAFTIAREVRRYGAVIFRAGAFKPRSSPYSFQGMGEDGLRILAAVREEFGLPVVSEITSPAYADLMAKHVDMLQIGARNMQNFELLKCVGRLGMPVMLKRGLAATIEEWLMSAEYIMAEGNDQIVICERGIRTYEPYTRNTLDLSAIPIMKNLTHLPIIIDPSHATGIREKVAPMARAAIAAGADGLMIEVHNDPGRAMSDGPQALFPKQFGRLMRDLYVIAPVVDKQVDFGYLEKAALVTPPAGAAGAETPRAAFQGELGVSDHKAIQQYFGADVAPEPQRTYQAVFDAVRDGRAEYGMIPLERATSGSVHENYDLLLDHDLRIVGEITLRIELTLATRPDVETDAVRRVVSSPTVFHHCDQFLQSHPDWERVYAEDAATAAALVEQKESRADAALTTPEAAALHGLVLRERNVETDPRNYTRFVVIAKTPRAHGPRRKSSLIYRTADRPGALFETLKVFTENDVNLVKLESRPVSGRPWEYMFYVDIEADAESPAFAPILKAIEEHTDYLKVLGAY